MRGRLRDYIKHRVIGTAAEPVALLARAAWRRGRAALRPGLRAVLVDEPAAIDELFARSITATTNCVDVGAHLGATTRQFTLLAPRGTHICVEPTPYKARWLRSAFRGVEVAEVALSSERGSADFFHQPKASAYSGLRRHEGGGMKGTDACRTTVRTERLDDVVPVERRVGFLKVDTEGAEAEVLRGATRILERDRPLILFECTQSGTHAFGSSPFELFELLTAKGYNLHTPQDFLAGGHALDSEAFERCTLYPFRSFNFVACPRAMAGAPLGAKASEVSRPG